jgi:Condensation domain
VKLGLYAGGGGKGRSKYGTRGDEVSTYSKHPEQRKAAAMSDFEPKNREKAAEVRVGGHPGIRTVPGFNSEPAARLLARHVLGLDEIESQPDALAARAEQLWRLDHFAANVPFTNPMFVPMGRSADIGLLYQAVATVVRRHEALRTRLAVRHDRAVQIVEDWKVSSLEVANVRKRDFADDRPGRKSAVSEFTQRSIDLYAQDGFQCQAFRDEDGDVTLGFLAHGYLSDAWSSQILFREVRAVHAALRDGHSVGLEPVTAQFRDYAQAQRRWLDRDLDTHLAYWHGKLKEMPTARLPGDHSGTSGRRGRSYFFIDNQIVARLTALAEANRISLTLVLLAVYQLTIAGWSGQREILSAAYTADRVDPRFRNTFGFLVANMPVCARLTPDITFGDFLREFARDFYGGYAHLGLSCELYEAIFSPEKPFCATVFNFVPLQKNFFDSELHSVPAFEGTIIGPDASRPAIYREIYLGLAQYPNGILGKLFYNADRFTPDGMEVFIEQFRRTILSITTGPNATLRDINN